MGTAGRAVVKKTSGRVGLSAAGKRRLFKADTTCPPCCGDPTPSCCACFSNQCPNTAVVTFSGIANTLGSDGACCGNFVPCGGGSTRMSGNFNRTFTFTSAFDGGDIGFGQEGRVVGALNVKGYEPTCQCAILAYELNLDIVCHFLWRCGDGSIAIDYSPYVCFTTGPSSIGITGNCYTTAVFTNNHSHDGCVTCPYNFGQVTVTLSRV